MTQNNVALEPLHMTSEGLATDFERYFRHTLGRDQYQTSSAYLFTALAYAVRDRLMERWNLTRHAYERHDSRRVCYLSMEYLIGRSLRNALLNLGISEEVAKGLDLLGLRLETIAEREIDAGLGNGGLGRLAACFLDSCATLQLPVIGYGLRYQYGMFHQRLSNGFQLEEPDHWLRDGYPWEIERAEFKQRIQFHGRSESYADAAGRQRFRWVESHDVLAIPYDIPVPGYRNETVNTLRLWSAVATDEFDLDEFNAGGYAEAVAAKTEAENITMVLYPNDASENGKELRLRQQYFLAAASLKDTLRQWVERHGEDFSTFADKHCFQLNDTHPAIAVAELMRLLLDEFVMTWQQAWEITSRCMAYTNHTLLPEALERWPVRLFERLLPRHLQIILEINARFLAEVGRRWPGDTARLRRLSLVEEGAEPMIRMAHLAVVGSFSVNGVAALHTSLLKQGLLRDFYQFWPEKFNNKTNGVTQRRWLALCNPSLTALLNDTLGAAWISDLSRLQELCQVADDDGFQNRWRDMKQTNKRRLAQLIRETCAISVNTDAMFDVQVKRIHEYKRQLLNILHVIHLYTLIKQGKTDGWVARCVIIAGKAAPGYVMAKSIVKLINNVAAVINADPEAADLLKVVFLPDYGVSAMELICPACELSEQISTAGKEASGTGNMKFMMNGAITIGTLDGANIEILEAVGRENFFLFGLTADEVQARHGHYDPCAIVAADPALCEVMQLLQSGYFNQFEPGLFDPVIASVLSPADPWMIAADFADYVKAQAAAASAYADPGRWARMSISNTAASGFFSTDRTMREYNREIWKLTPVSAASV